MRIARRYFTKANNIDVLSIAIPMVISNITVPLLGLVDAAVIGHLPDPAYLGGVAIGGSILNIILWLFGFLRMATTGITAQAYGAVDNNKRARVLLQGIAISIVFSVAILLLSWPISQVVLSFSEASSTIKDFAKQYFLIRVLSCPAALINLVSLGWLLGSRQPKLVMRQLITTNLINIVLDLVFVPGLKMGIKGAAIASVIADYSGLILGLYHVVNIWKADRLPKVTLKITTISENIFELLKLNLDIFIRSLFLQAVFGFMTFKGAAYGDNIAAANAILINFLLFIAYIMDGFAHTLETLIGSSLGAKDKSKLKTSMIITVFWSLIVSLLCTLVFGTLGERIIHFTSSIDAVRIESKIYLPWLIAFPLISMWSFLLDGLFIGATLGREMRNSMIIAATVYFISYSVLVNYDNHALWGSLLIFMAARWIVMSYILKLKPI